MGQIEKYHIPPEVALADKFLSLFPRVGTVTESEFERAVNFSNPEEVAIQREYATLALAILKEEKLIETIEQKVLGKTESKYFLTKSGRERQDGGGYLKWYIANNYKETLAKKSSIAEGKKKIFDNRVKLLLFIIAIITCVATVWKYFFNSENGTSRNPAIVKQVPNIRDSLITEKSDSNTHKNVFPKTHPKQKSSIRSVSIQLSEKSEGYSAIFLDGERVQPSNESTKLNPRFELNNYHGKGIILIVTRNGDSCWTTLPVKFDVIRIIPNCI